VSPVPPYHEQLFISRNFLLAAHDRKGGTVVGAHGHLLFSLLEARQPLRKKSESLMDALKERKGSSRPSA